jgi:hypothetical protein
MFMSKYLAFTKVVFNDRALLVAALESIGCAEIRQGENLVMGSYWKEQNGEKADIIVPRYSVGNSFGDIGFQRIEGGGYAPVIDELDQSRALGGKFIPLLRAAYNERAVAEITTRVRGTLHRTQQGSVVKIKVRF